jgi:predicted phosphate transport protein (TIGR00153 family)
MKVLRLFRGMMPKEDRFFDLLERHSKLVVAGAEALRAALNGGPDLDRHIATVMEREDDADAVTHEVFLAVRRSFITPFDRGDIKDLITSMDDAIDEMRKTVKTVTLFKVRTFEPEMRQMADGILRGSRIVQQTIPLLRSVGPNANQIASFAEEISKVEGETDDRYDAARSRLFQSMGPAQALDFWVTFEILNHLERVMDRLEDVAHEMHGIMIEHV